MKLQRLLMIPGLAAAAVVLAACSASGSIEIDPFPNEEARAVSAATVDDPAAVDVTIGSNGSQLFLIDIPQGVAAHDAVWFSIDETSGVESIELYDVSPLGGSSVRLQSNGSGWFDVPGALSDSPAALEILNPAQITPTFSCSGPCIALAGSETGSSRYLRVNAAASGAEFDLYVFGRDFDSSGGMNRSGAAELELGDTELGSISLSGMEQWYTADGVVTITLSRFDDTADQAMAFEADVYVGGTFETTLDDDIAIYSFSETTDDVYVVVRSFNDTRAAAQGDARFSLVLDGPSL